MFCAAATTFALLYVPQPLLPLLSAHFRLSPGQAALALSAATLSLGLCLVPAGALSDRYGRRRIMLTSLVVSTLLGLACALAPNWPWLLGLRLAEGIALAGLPAVAMAYLREEIDPRSHARATGLYIGGTALGGLAGRIVSALLAEVGGWRLAFFGIALLAGCCVVVAATLLPASTHFTRTAQNSAGTTRRALQGKLPLLYCVGGLSMGAFVGVHNAMAFRLSAAPYFLTPGWLAAVFCVYVVGIVASPVAGRCADRLGRPVVTLVGLAGMGLGAALTLTHSLWAIVTGLALFTGAFFAAHAVASGWVTARAQRIGAPVGTAAGLYLLGYYLGSSVFGVTAGDIWSRFGWAGVVTMAVTTSALAALMAMRASVVPSRPSPE
jgi:YNFM family putative membrane transporter